MVSNKRGWIRILEATIAVMLVAGVLTIIYASETTDNQLEVDQLKNVQEIVLKEISTKDDLRDYVLSEDLDSLNQSVAAFVPSHLGYSLRVCNLSAPCKLDSSTFKDTLTRDVVAESTIIASNLSEYDPKKAVLFLWYR